MFHERVSRPRPPALKLRWATFAVQSLAPPTEAALAAQVGGARRDRTDDLLLAKQALSQLSYGPSAAIREIRDELGGPGKI